MKAVIRTLLDAARTTGDHSPGSSDASTALSVAIDAIATQAKPKASRSERTRPAPRCLPGGHRPDRPSAAPAARQRRPPCGHRIDVRLERRDGQVVFAVGDDGPGQAELNARIFEPGTSDQGSAARPALARRLARACAGDVTLAAPDQVRFELMSGDRALETGRRFLSAYGGVQPPAPCHYRRRARLRPAA
jgi:hypothetical protein